MGLPQDSYPAGQLSAVIPYGRAWFTIKSEWVDCVLGKSAKTCAIVMLITKYVLAFKKSERPLPMLNIEKFVDIF